MPSACDKSQGKLGSLSQLPSLVQNQCLALWLLPCNASTATVTFFSWAEL